MDKKLLEEVFQSAFSEAKNDNIVNLNFGVYYTPGLRAA